MLHVRYTSPSNMPAWYLLWLDPWQLSLMYSNSATELPKDLVAQLVRAQRGLYHFPTYMQIKEKVLRSGQ